MPKERNKADGYREKAPIKREKSDVFIDSSEREVSRPKVKAYEGDTMGFVFITMRQYFS